MRSPRRERGGRRDGEPQGDVLTIPRMTVLVVGATGSIGRLVVE
jgi:FlaA1/EpsC-like NDP-sugar epimerase